MPGTIIFKPIEAKLTHDTDFITKMSPYCSFIVGEKRVKGQVCSKGGMHPHWNDAVTIPVTNHSKVVVELMDQGTLLPDSTIGSCVIDLQELQTTMEPTSKWYSLYYKQKPAGVILMESRFRDELSSLGGFDGTSVSSTHMQEQALVSNVFQEQQQIVEPHTFKKEIDVVETRPILKEVQVMEPIKVMKEVECTEAVPVMKQIETVEPHMVRKEIEVMEPRLVTKTIQVVEEVPVKREVEVMELKTNVQEVESVEPRTFKKLVEVTEYVPVKKMLEETQPVTVKKTVEYVEPVITTQTVTKATFEPVVVDQKITTSIGPATVVGMSKKHKKETSKMIIEEKTREVKMSGVEKMVIEGEIGTHLGHSHEHHHTHEHGHEHEHEHEREHERVHHHLPPTGLDINQGTDLGVDPTLHLPATALDINQEPGTDPKI